MKTSFRIALTLTALSLLAACGAKGPLFMPTQQAPIEAPADEPVPAEQPATEPAATTPDGRR